MEFDLLLIIIFFVIFISIQYTLNKILTVMNDIKKILVELRVKQ